MQITLNSFVHNFHMDIRLRVINSTRIQLYADQFEQLLPKCIEKYVVLITYNVLRKPMESKHLPKK
jgi:hypothetical protein